MKFSDLPRAVKARRQRVLRFSRALIWNMAAGRLAAATAAAASLKAAAARLRGLSRDRDVESWRALCRATSALDQAEAAGLVPSSPVR